VQGEFDEALAEERLELERRGDTGLLAALEEGLDAGNPKGAMRAMAEALLWLNNGSDYGSYEITYLAFRPDFEFMQDDQRCQDLFECVHRPNVRGSW